MTTKKKRGAPRKTERDARIVEAAASGEPYASIAARYGISPQRAGQIANTGGVRRAWDGLADDPDARCARDELIRQRIAEGVSFTRIAEEVGVTRERVRQIAKKLGVRSPHRHQTPQEIAEIVRESERFRVEGVLPLRDVAERLGVRRDTLTKWRAKAGVPRFEARRPGGTARSWTRERVIEAGRRLLADQGELTVLYFNTAMPGATDHHRAVKARLGLPSMGSIVDRKRETVPFRSFAQFAAACGSKSRAGHMVNEHGELEPTVSLLRRRGRLAPRGYTDAEIDAALVAKHAELGRVPTQSEWEEAGWRPRASTLYARRGGWGAAWRRVGLEPVGQSREVG